jgi:hypothetical protein
MTTATRDIVDALVERVVAEFQSRQVYLFGSHAWGRPEADSDIDLMIVVDPMPESPTRMARRAYRGFRGISHPTDVLFRRTDSFDRRSAQPGALEHEIVRRGERVHGWRPFARRSTPG